MFEIDPRVHAALQPSGSRPAREGNAGIDANRKTIMRRARRRDILLAQQAKVSG